MRRLSTVACAACALSGAAAAQFGNDWVSFQQQSARLAHPSTYVSDFQTEVDFAWADLDQDGWTDLVAVRKTPVTSAGKWPNFLLMNRGGVLVDESATYASSTSVTGDQGFLTPTNDRDVAIADLDNDGWLDVITATTLSFGDPKHISHPRIYRNLGRNAQGQWRGLRFEDARIPQFFTTTGTPTSPMFCSVSAGDVTGDGFADLYFSDYDSGGIASLDLNDRLLINDGTGHFSDQSNRMQSSALNSNFGMASFIADINMDGRNDVLKDTALGLTQVVVSYNSPTSFGQFPVFDIAHTSLPYHTTMGDLNNDGRPDMVVTDDGADKYRLNLSTDAFGRAVWSTAQTFQFVSGSDDGFGGNNWIADLDNDGWNDVIITDVDVDISGCSRRTHVYHNLGGVVGGIPPLREERESSSGAGWLGAVGLHSSDLTGTHDVAVFDIDNDGWLDMVLGRCTGTFVWMNEGDGPPATKGRGTAGPLRGPVSR